VTATPMNNDDGSSGWIAYADGETLDKVGAEGGRIFRDEGHDDGAQITLEGECLRAPYAITALVYGWLVHTRFIADKASAMHAYEQMRASLSSILALLEQSNRTDNPDAIDAAVAAFAAQYP